MPGLRILLAAVTIGLLSSAAPARAIPIQNAETLRQVDSAGAGLAEHDPITGTLVAPTAPALPPLGPAPDAAVAGDPCARQPGWLIRGGSGVLSCGAIIDLLVPTAEDGRTAGGDRAVQGSLLALLVLGLAALAFAARRPVWIARLMR